MKKAFTLIELMIVIAIIALISGLIIAAIQNARRQSGDARVKSDLAQIRLQLQNYQVNNGNYTIKLSSATCPSVNLVYNCTITGGTSCETRLKNYLACNSDDNDGTMQKLETLASDVNKAINMNNNGLFINVVDPQKAVIIANLPSDLASQTPYLQGGKWLCFDYKGNTKMYSGFYDATFPTIPMCSGNPTGAISHNLACGAFQLQECL